MGQEMGLQLFAISHEEAMQDAEFAKQLVFAEDAGLSQLKQMKRKRTQENLIGILLAKRAIHKKWGLIPEEIQFEVGSHGKPYVIGHEYAHFNISHSGNMCVCAVDDTPVGVDIQKMDDRNFNGIAKRFFTPEEQAYFVKANGDAQAFYHIWTQRESVGKYLGYGFYYKQENDTADWQVKHTIYKNDYMLCVCTQKK